MTQFLITDARTNASEWIAAATVTAALIQHANARRTSPLPASTKASHQSRGDILDVSLADSVCRGLRGNVVRDGEV